MDRNAIPFVPILLQEQPARHATASPADERPKFVTRPREVPIPA
jgi:hypothetical protein